MTGLTHFLQVIREQPDADGPRLIMADWLEEQGQQTRAEYIRLACRLEEIPKYDGATIVGDFNIDQNMTADVEHAFTVTGLIHASDFVAVASVTANTPIGTLASDVAKPLRFGRNEGRAVMYAMETSTGDLVRCKFRLIPWYDGAGNRVTVYRGYDDPHEAERLRLRRRLPELLQAHETEWLKDSPLLWAGWQANSTWVPSFEWTWRRGFVEEVRCTLADWYGGACPRSDCAGGKVIRMHDHELIFPVQVYCPVCGGSTKVGGHGPAILRTQPVLRVVTNTEPQPFDVPEKLEATANYAWSREAVGDDLFEAMNPGPFPVIHKGKQAAMQYLSDWLIQWALMTSQYEEASNGSG